MAADSEIQAEERAWLAQKIAQAQMRNFYGTLTIIFEAGAIKRVVREESELFVPSRRVKAPTVRLAGES